jgi:tetratricopeptide (TPR) repeat protein
MTGKSLQAIGVAALLVWAASAAGQSTRPSPESQKPEPTPDERAERLATFVRAVEAAAHPREAITAYARGCAVDRSRPEIHNAYLRRMLTFGLPQIAYYPARVLVTMEPDNGTAWGVVGYMHGRRGELDKALSATLQAVQLAREDPSILHNAGQLTAWYDHEIEPPKIPDRSKRALARVREELAKAPAFAKAYGTIESAYQRRAALAKEFDQKIAAADAEVLTLERLALEIDRKLRDLADEIEYRQDLIDGLRRELQPAGWGYYVDPYGRIISYPRYGPRRGDVRARIREQERIIDELKLKIRVLRREGRDVLADLKRKRSDLEGLRKQMKQALAAVERRFRWDPPAVDGVVTDELEQFPPAPTTTRSVPEDAESAAEKRLDMARLYLRHDLHDKAVEILRAIIKNYGSTKASEQARQLLDTLTTADQRPAQ